jgi:hypothetical protein
MKIIMSTWLDSTNQPYLTEFFDSDMFESEIMDAYVNAKSHYNHKVITRNNEYVVFSDGSRVMLSLHHVKTNIYDEGKPSIHDNPHLRLSE